MCLEKHGTAPCGAVENNEMNGRVQLEQCTLQAVQLDDSKLLYYIQRPNSSTSQIPNAFIHDPERHSPCIRE